MFKKLMDTLMWFAALLLFYWILTSLTDYATCKAQGKRPVNAGFSLNCE